MNNIIPGNAIKCNNNQPLKGNTIAPPLEVGKQYHTVQVFKCQCGSEHIDVGLKSEYNFISCYECKQTLRGGNKIHWCHPSRFEKIIK